MKNIKFYLPALFCALQAPAAVSAQMPAQIVAPSSPTATRSPPVSDQVKLARDFALSVGNQNFLILDKRAAVLIAFENGQEVFRTDVFIGRSLGDDPNAAPNVTRAGSFNAVVRGIYNPNPNRPSERYGTSIPFRCVTTEINVTTGVSKQDCDSIHPTLQTQAEQRALATHNPALRRQSDACVRAVNYPPIVDLMVKHGGSMLFIVLPSEIAETRAYLQIPPSFEPETIPSGP